MSKIPWKNLLLPSIYRQKFILLIILSIVMLIAMPRGFSIIQSRGGILWHDIILKILPAIDLSLPIFITMYSLAILLIFRAISNANLVYEFLKSYLMITIFRFIFMTLIPLDPPLEMVSLTDPFTKIFYGGVEITRDLFFSGHTSTMFLIFLILERRNDKIYALIITLFIAISLLFQHIHYTADVLAAFPITYGVWKFTNRF